MITALQHFISKKGKFVFILLLLLVIVSFVLYLSQGSSVFDLMSDGGRERKEFYGYDWNDPDQRRFLSVTTRAAGAIGAVVSPIQKVVDQADSTYMQGLQQQIQAAFRSNRDDMDQDSMQRMFQYMQAWPNFSRDFKVREIVRSGAYDGEFLEESIKTRVTLEGQADNWSFLPAEVNHPAINAEFTNFLTSLDPSLELESNRSKILSTVGGRFGMSGNEFESVLYNVFRNSHVDRVFTHRGFALPAEVDVLSQQNGFAWDGKVAVVSADALKVNRLTLGEIALSKLPANNDHLSISVNDQLIKFEFASQEVEGNQSLVRVPLGANPKQCARNLVNAINKSALNLEAFVHQNTKVRLQIDLAKLPKTKPAVITASSALSFKNILQPKLKAFHAENTNLDAFMEEPRTFATAMIFPSKKFFVQPPAADEARLRSYFERNQLDFLPENQPEKTDGNQTEQPSVNFEDVVDQVREKVEAQDVNDAKREADRLAQNAALLFLDELNRFSDQIKRNFSDFSSLRNSQAFKDFLSRFEADQKKISFSQKDMNVQGMILGLEKRASEQKANKQALEEVESLNPSMFFTRSIRKCRDGQAVFLLDRKTEEYPAKFASLSFVALCNEYAKHLSDKEFNEKVDEVDALLAAGKGDKERSLEIYVFEKKNASSAGAYYDTLQRSLRSKVEQLEQKRPQDLKKKDASNQQLEKELGNLRNQLTELNLERSAIRNVLTRADSLEVNGKWSELERNEEQATFVLLEDVYSTRGKQLEEEQKNVMNTNLEFSRGMFARDETIRELLDKSLSE